MGILNRPSDGQLTVLLALVRTLKAYGPMTETRLKSLCAPPGLVPPRPDSESQIHKTLSRWKRLGLFLEKSDKADAHLVFAPSLDRADLSDIETLRSTLRSIVLDERNNSDSDAGNDADTGDASDFSLAAAWFLQQDPYLFSAKWSDVDQQQVQQRVEPRFFTNSTRWDGFVDWVPFLGLARIERSQVMPNPIHALRGVLADIFGRTQAMPIRDFLGRFAARVPVMDRGRYWATAARRVQSPSFTLGPTDVSPSTTLALLQLDRERRINLERRSDAREVFRLLGRGARELRQVTHVALASANNAEVTT
jgi:hypothetical protein